MPQPIDSQINELFAFDMNAEVEKITARIRELLRSHLHKRGLVVAISGGIDSSVCTALAVKAVGAGKVFGILMPERDSSSESVTKGKIITDLFGIDHVI